MSNELCIHNSLMPLSALANLPESQGGTGRHKCTICAYSKGFDECCNYFGMPYQDYLKKNIDVEKCKHGSIAPSQFLHDLELNQGGTGRHKCAICAFQNGYNAGITLSSATIDYTICPPPVFNSQIIYRNHTNANTNYIQKQINNSHLGSLGEHFVIEYEIIKLKNAGLNSLTQQIEHLPTTKGDGFGVDIKSFDLNGNEIYIEVKSTRSKIDTPFYITKNEIDFSKSHRDEYFLYRLFDFNPASNQGKIYILNGDMEAILPLKPILFLV